MDDPDSRDIICFSLWGREKVRVFRPHKEKREKAVWLRETNLYSCHALLCSMPSLKIGMRPAAKLLCLSVLLYHPTMPAAGSVM